jgi:hypothetical protein
MPKPIEMNYAGARIFLHEPGCECGLDHDGMFNKGDAKVGYLTTLDERTNIRYFQVWYRTGKWDLHAAINMLLERKRTNTGGRAA